MGPTLPWVAIDMLVCDDPFRVPGFFEEAETYASEQFFLQTCAVVSGGDVRKGPSACWSRSASLSTDEETWSHVPSPGREGRAEPSRRRALQQVEPLSNSHRPPVAAPVLVGRAGLLTAVLVLRGRPWCPGLDYSRLCCNYH